MSGIPENFPSEEEHTDPPHPHPALGIKEDSQEEEYYPEDEEPSRTRGGTSYRPSQLKEATNLPRQPKPQGRAKIIPCHNAPVFTNPRQYKSWRSRFLNFVFSIDPLYRQILEDKAIGNYSHEEQLFNAIGFSVGEEPESLEVIDMLTNSSYNDRGSRAWSSLTQRYDRVSESKVQRLLDSHRRPQGPQESIAAYVQRYQVQHEELKLFGHPHTQRTTVTCMLNGLRNEFHYIRQYFRINKQAYNVLSDAVDICLELYDERQDRREFNPSADRPRPYQQQLHPNNQRGPPPSAHFTQRQHPRRPWRPGAASPRFAAPPRRQPPTDAPLGSPTTPWWRRSGPQASPAPAPAGRSTSECQFCGKQGHDQSDCFHYNKFRKQLREQQQQHQQNQRPRVHFAPSPEDADSEGEADQAALWCQALKKSF